MWGCKLILSRANWKLNAKPALLLHCDGADESPTFTDSSASNHTVTRSGSAQIDTDQSKWGASGLFDGNSDYLTVPNHANWDISTNFTIDLHVRMTANNDFGQYLTQWEDETNFWSFYSSSTSAIRFTVYKSSSIVALSSSPIGIADTNWHHVALCKVGDEYGIYLDSIQIAHTSDSDTDTLTADLIIGYYPEGGGGRYFTGHMDEIRIVHANPFGAAPNLGKTDTIIVPTRPYISWR